MPPNPPLHPTRYSQRGRHPRAGELKRYAAFSAAWIRCAMAATGHEPPLPTGSLPASL
jgi:hypothetical protein